MALEMVQAGPQLFSFSYKESPLAGMLATASSCFCSGVAVPCPSCFSTACALEHKPLQSCRGLVPLVVSQPGTRAQIAETS